MAYYNVCPNCGSNLDPNEKCDCESTQEREKKQSRAYYRKYLRMDGRGGQMAFCSLHTLLENGRFTLPISKEGMRRWEANIY